MIKSNGKSNAKCFYILDPSQLLTKRQRALTKSSVPLSLLCHLTLRGGGPCVKGSKLLLVREVFIWPSFQYDFSNLLETKLQDSMSKKNSMRERERGLERASDFRLQTKAQQPLKNNHFWNNHFATHPNTSSCTAHLTKPSFILHRAKGLRMASARQAFSELPQQPPSVVFSKSKSLTPEVSDWEQVPFILKGKFPLDFSECHRV